MAKKRGSITNLATRGRKPEEKVSVETVDEQAKARVEKLVDEVTLDPQPNDLLVLEDEKDGVIFDDGSLEWLKEQVGTLSEEREVLRAEVAQAKEDYARLFEENQSLKQVEPDAHMKSAITRVFHELQSNHMKMGKDPATGKPNFVVIVPAFLNRLIMFFPFLESEKRI